MLIYEVNLSVEPDVADEYEAWLARHIEEILVIDGFTSAEWFELTDVPTDRREYVVHYRISNRTALERYFRDHAERMRQDGTERFGGRFTASRRVMEWRRGFEDVRERG